jgi:hypothetical protein
MKLLFVLFFSLIATSTFAQSSNTVSEFLDPDYIYEGALDHGSYLLSGESPDCSMTFEEGMVACKDLYSGHLNLTMQYLISIAIDENNSDWDFYISDKAEADAFVTLYHDTYVAIEYTCNEETYPDQYDAFYDCIISGYENLLLDLVGRLWELHDTNN